MGSMSNENRAILKVAYMLATLDGEISSAKLEAFKQVCFADKAFFPGTEEANSLLEEVVREAQNLQSLKNFYSKGEFELAFATKFFPICKELRQYPAISRYAFAVWMGLEMADGSLEDSDRKNIKALQKMFSNDFDLSKYFVNNQKWLENVPADNWLRNRLIGALKAKYENDVISDEFLAELEDDCNMLIDLKKSIDAANDEGQKKSLQASFDYIENNLKEMIKNGLN